MYAAFYIDIRFYHCYSKVNVIIFLIFNAKAYRNRNEIEKYQLAFDFKIFMRTKLYMKICSLKLMSGLVFTAIDNYKLSIN